MFSPKPHGFNSVEVIESSTDCFGAWMGREFPSMPIVLLTVQGKIQANGWFSSPQEAELGNPRAAEICGKSA